MAFTPTPRSLDSTSKPPQALRLTRPPMAVLVWIVHHSGRKDTQGMKEMKEPLPFSYFPFGLLRPLVSPLR